MTRKWPGTAEFGKRLRSLRKATGLTVRKTAAAIEVSPATYREWEKGRSITGQPYLRLSQIFGVSLQELFGVNDRNRDQLLELIAQAQKVLGQIKEQL